MSDDLRTAILDAKYIDLIALAGGLAAELGGSGDTQVAGPDQQRIAAAIFRWAAEQVEPEVARETATPMTPFSAAG